MKAHQHSLVAGLLVTSVLTTVSTADINVPGDAPTIQAAINAAVDGEHIVVAPGRRHERIDFKGKAITVRSTDPSDPEVVAATIIDGIGLGGSVVTCQNAEGPDTVLSGFVITGGVAPFGGGMFNHVNTSPTVTNCTFTGNSADSGGGMLNSWYCAPTIIDCTFIGNTAEVGAGMSNGTYSNATLANCTFSGNSAYSSGGGMINGEDSTPTLINCVFIANTVVQGSGGGMSNWDGTPTLIDCTFSDNSATKHGGAMTNWASLYQTSPTITNCTFTDNSSGANGGAIRNFKSSPTVTGCTFSGNTAAIGGAMRNWRVSRPQVIDCSFTANTTTDDGGAVFNNDDCYMPMADSVVCGNMPDQVFGPLNDQGGNLIADVCTACIEADLDGDGTVDIADFLVLLTAWGPNPEHPADLNGDGLVGIVDFLELLAAWSDCR